MSQMNKKFIKIVIGILLIMLVSACGTNSTKDETTNNDTKKKVTDTTENEQVTNDDNNEENNESVKDGESDTGDEVSQDGIKNDESEKVIKKEVTYVGLADPHTIEVQDGKDYLSLQIDPDTMNEWGKIKENTKMTIEYYENEAGQNILKSYKVK